MTDTEPGQAQLVVYTTTWCGPCSRLKARLTERGVLFDEVDIEDDSSGADWVSTVNGGMHLIPTVRFSDGTAMANPSVDAVLERLGSLAHG
ncbi:MAG: NrdH-redoxin [Actinomycetia bacterium]|nr:NrdH-redoxin [Actinomycetes bacterium]